MRFPPLPPLLPLVRTRPARTAGAADPVTPTQALSPVSRCQGVWTSPPTALTGGGPQTIGITVRNGSGGTPAISTSGNDLDAWNHVTVNLAANNANKQISRILVGYDQPGARAATAATWTTSP